jgi:prepilin-type processing-associated H-X9-DG protein
MAIIGILAALLLPALARARARSQRLACLSNMHQVGIAFTLRLSDNADRFPDRRDLKLALGYRPWTTWPPSDPRGGWASLVLSNELAHSAVWTCPSLVSSPLRDAVQCSQLADTNNPDSKVTYWLWRFDRPDDPIPLDEFWGKAVSRCVSDLVEANNPAAGQPAGPTEVELMVDPYFPETIGSVASEMRGDAVHSGGRNRLFLDGHAAFEKDARLR